MVGHFRHCRRGRYVIYIYIHISFYLYTCILLALSFHGLSVALLCVFLWNSGFGGPVSGDGPAAGGAAFL